MIITGFEPFLEHSANPSQLTAQALDGQVIGGAKIHSLILPVVFGEDTKILLPAIDEIEPILILNLGLMASAKQIEVEMFAVNHKREAAQSNFTPIDPNGPAAYFASIEPLKIAEAIKTQTGQQAAPHGYAGAYLCNHIMYRTLRRLDLKSSSCKAGFIHLPYNTENAPDNRETISLDSMIEAIRAAIGISL